MILSVEGYYNKYLKGKTEKELKKIIRELRKEMVILKDTMEHPDYIKKTTVKQDEDMRLDYCRKYLDRTKQALEEIGITYSPTKAELKVAEFEESISAICRLKFSIGGFFDGDTEYIISVNGDYLQNNVNKAYSQNPEDLKIMWNQPCSKTDLLMGIRKLHIGEWVRPYCPERFGYSVLDGTQWNLVIEFSNGRKTFEVSGSNAYPYNFNAFMELIGIDEKAE